MNVSVVLPTYNSMSFIDCAMQSIQAQSMKDLEIVVVDDGSTDGTVDLLDRYSRQDTRVHVLHQATNGGVGKARNRGMSIAQGEWIAVLDSDDWWDSERLEQLTQYAINHDWDIILDDFWLVSLDSGGSPNLSRRWSTIHTEIQDVLGKCLTACDIAKTSVAFLKPIIRREWLMTMRYQWPDWRYSEDFGFLLGGALLGAKVGVFPEALYHYRANRPESLTSHSLNLFKGVRDSAAFYEHLLKTDKTNKIEETDACNREQLKILLTTRRRKAQKIYALRYLLNRLIPNHYVQKGLLNVYHRFREF